MIYYESVDGRRRKAKWEIVWSIKRFPELWQKVWGNHSMDSAKL